MKKHAIIIDSTVYLTKEQIKDNELTVVSLNVVEGDVSKREVDVDNNYIFSRQEAGASFTTSQPSPGEFLENYEELISKGYEKVFVVCLSKNISGTFQSANLAKNMLDDPDKVYIFDTMLAAYGTEMIAEQVIKMVNENKPEEEVIAKIDNIISTSGQMFTVENLFSLVKGGRISGTSAAIGTVLRIKPIIKIINGKLEVVNKERTYKKVHNYMVQNVIEDSKELKKLTFRVTSHNSLESAENLKAIIEEKFPNSEIIFTKYLGPVFSIHVGKKGYGLSWFAE
jgi:DegV family protein with EDD domain